MTFDPGDQHDPELDRVLQRLVGRGLDDAPRSPALAGDDDIVTRNAASALARWDATTGNAWRKKTARKVWSRWLIGLGGGAAILGTLATTSNYANRAAVGPAPVTTSHETTPPEPLPVPPAERSVVEPIPAFDVSALPSVTPSVGPSGSSLRPTTSATARSAAEMFAAANEARRARDATAPALYRDLQKAHPSSPEAVMSYVTLGRLELDRGHPAVALSQFDHYLSANTVELREDALVGRATALENLGRGTEEARAWERLLAEYPQTLLATHAKERLQTLR